MEDLNTRFNKIVENLNDSRKNQNSEFSIVEISEQFINKGNNRDLWPEYPSGDSRIMDFEYFGIYCNKSALGELEYEASHLLFGFILKIAKDIVKEAENLFKPITSGRHSFNSILLFDIMNYVSWLSSSYEDIDQTIVDSISRAIGKDDLTSEELNEQFKNIVKYINDFDSEVPQAFDTILLADTILYSNKALDKANGFNLTAALYLEYVLLGILIATCKGSVNEAVAKKVTKYLSSLEEYYSMRRAEYL